MSAPTVCELCRALYHGDAFASFTVRSGGWDDRSQRSEELGDVLRITRRGKGAP